MVRYARFKFIKLLIAILFFFLFAIIELLRFNSAETDGMSFSEHLIIFFDMNMGYKYTSLFKVASHMLPVLYFLFTSGIDLYNDWSIDSVYSIIRYHSRVRRYFKRILTLFGQTFLFSAAYLFMLILIYNFSVSEYHSYTADYIIGMLAVFSAQLFSCSVLFSLISMKFGTSYGFFIIVLYFLLSLKTSLYMVEYHSSVAGIFGIVSFSMSIINSIKTEVVSESIILSAITQVSVTTLIGYVVIQRSDIGFIDKEME